MDERFLRHFIIREIGKKGQKNISKGKVLVVGIGGLGSPAITYLVANGIGKIGIVDYDTVDITNLNRQILHYPEDIGRKKIKSALEKIKKINPEIEVQSYDIKITEDNAQKIFNEYDFIIDATDNLKTKLLINDICVKIKKPFNYAGIDTFFGSTITVNPGKSACLRCIFKNINEEVKKTIGVFGPVPGILGTIQAAEALKFVGKFGKLLTDKILIIDIYHMDFRVVETKISKNCLCNN